PDPCSVALYRRAAPSARAAVMGSLNDSARERALGVTVEARYTIGEYDILILSAKESAGLETWLRESGYRIPAKAPAALAPYIRQDMKFFVAKVNLQGHKEAGFNYLRPIQIAYESKKFMLPIRLGMANASGPQDLVIYTLTRQGRVESSNYRTVKMPTGMDLPLAIKDDFGSFYKAAYQHAHESEGGRGLFTQYAWNMAWCDPCPADPLSPAELQQLGVFWLESGPAPMGVTRSRAPWMGGAPVFLTRLHVRYDGEHFPEDLVFQETGDQENFQARYVLRHPFAGSASCAVGGHYRHQLEDRRRTEAQTLAQLTGWRTDVIRQKTGTEASPKPWYQRLWSK